MPQLNELTMDVFRRELAGIKDPVDAPQQGFERYRKHAVDLAYCMAIVYGDQLDRKVMWDKIGSGLRAAAQRCPQGGEALVSAAFRHVLADAGRAASNDKVIETLSVIEEQSAEWNRGWAAYIARNSVIVTVFARSGWKGAHRNG